MPRAVVRRLRTTVTILFLNSILIDQPRIPQVKFRNPFVDKKADGGRLSVLDVLATHEYGRWLIIEMQTTRPAGMAQRLAYYVSALYVGQLSEGGFYRGLRPAISICVQQQATFTAPLIAHPDFACGRSRRIWL